MNPIGIGFLGSGGVAELHARALTGTRGQLRAVWSRDAGKAQAFATRHGARAYDSVQALLADPTIEAVFVLTALAGHVELAEQALAAGKHVLLEKPVAPGVEGVRRLQAAARASSCWCVPVHNYVYAPEVQSLKRHLDAGRLGRPHSLWVLYNQGHSFELTPDTMVSELMIHPIYTMLHLLGRPLRLNATGSDARLGVSGPHDQIMITAQYGGGLIANLWGSFAADDRSREPWTVQFKLIGSQGTGMVAWDQIKFDTEALPGWDDAAYLDSFLYTQRHFLDDCIGQGKPALSTLDDALSAALIQDAVREAIRSGRSVDLPAAD
jgi:predicted dehydrogenase